jgi:hypothetical protein
LDDHFEDMPVAAKPSLLTAIISKITILREKIVVGIKNPGFEFGTLDGVGLTPCYSGGQRLAYCERWLPEPADIRAKSSWGATH